MSIEENVFAKDGKVHIRVASGYDFDHDELTLREASDLIGDIAIAVKEARRQLAAVAKACAIEHNWGPGWNSPVGEKTTVYHCARQGCEGRKEEPGWLPFEPKQHVVPFARTLQDCTGPGCEWCSNEAYADLIDRTVKETLAQHLGEALGGPKVPDGPPLTVKKIGYQWPIDATPEQVQAALDARDAMAEEK